MVIRRSVYLRFDEIAPNEGVLTLCHEQLGELYSELVSFPGSSCAALGMAVKALVERERQHHG